MKNIIILSAVLAVTVAAPTNDYNSYVPLSKSTFTSSSQAVDHGSTHVLHPVLPLAKSTLTHSTHSVDHGSTHILHAPLIMHDVEYHVPLAKTTVTKSNQVVDHGSSALIHAPILHTHVAHAPVYLHSEPIVSYRTPDSAISHHSSTVHETVPLVNSYYAFHH
ncbi:uncharacterized protein LOC116769127 [Danaus plexippus]|uniref:uncharacterized protein LOC116769127 n=1 Tax=Danaus plexippus TaxID=13037 RepID=UPI002AB15EA8|nr:uncharacterized protein LOC116769127 [Danaus plexippus]